MTLHNSILQIIALGLGSHFTMKGGGNDLLHLLGDTTW